MTPADSAFMRQERVVCSRSLSLVIPALSSRDLCHTSLMEVIGMLAYHKK